MEAQKDSGSPRHKQFDTLDLTMDSQEEKTLDTVGVVYNPVGLDLRKKRKRKLRRKRKKPLLSKVEVQRAKDFIYSSENEQFSVEKLRTMVEDMTEFLDAIWDVYRSEAKQKGDERGGGRVQGDCSAEMSEFLGEGSWRDLQLLSRAKSVLVLRSKNLAASTIASVENELGYDADVRGFIVRMLKFWMAEIIRKD